MSSKRSCIIKPTCSFHSCYRSSRHSWIPLPLKGWENFELKKFSPKEGVQNFPLKRRIGKIEGIALKSGGLGRGISNYQLTLPKDIFLCVWCVCVCVCVCVFVCVFCILIPFLSVFLAFRRKELVMLNLISHDFYK